MSDQEKKELIQKTSRKFAPNISKKSLKNARQSNNKTGIPKDVANRMARRIAFTTGIPTFSGMGVFIGSYFLVSKGILEISPGITLITSATCFLIGLLGLSYGLLSASWDKSPGTFLGLENIRPNLERTKAAFQTTNQKPKD